MIYIFYGSDHGAKKDHIDRYTRGTSKVKIPSHEIKEDIVLGYAEQNSLFGEKFSVILEEVISGSNLALTKDLLEKLQNSQTIFILLEDSLLAEEVKKYKKYAEIAEKFELKNSPSEKTNKENPFVVANMFGARNKIGTWVAYRKLVEKGGGAEPIAGMLFWKIKTMLLSGNSKFKEEELKTQSKEMIDIYHKAHMGLLDMDIALEQFILRNL